MKYINTIKVDELSLYAICYSALLGLIFNFRGFITLLITDYPSKNVPLLVIFIIFVIFLIILSIYHTFSSRQKYYFEKQLMILVILFNLIFSVISSIAFLQHKNFWLYPFPLFNLIHGSILIFLIRSGIFNEDNISDEDADIRLVITSTIIMTTTFLVSKYYFNHHFLFTYPICLTINYLTLSFIYPLTLSCYIKLKNIVAII